MRKMTRLLLLTFLFSCAGMVSAQTDSDTPSDESYLGEKGSSIFELGFSYYIPAADGADYAGTIAFDLQGGKYLLENLFLKGGIGVTNTSINFYNDAGSDDDYRTTTTALRLPINIGYTLPFASRYGLSLYTGPDLNLTIAGKQEVGNETTKLSDMEKVKRFSANWNIGATLKLWIFGLTAEYLIPLGKDSDIKYGGFGFGLKFGF